MYTDLRPPITVGTMASLVEALLLGTREPLGMVGLIAPRKFPRSHSAWRFWPALAHGNTAVPNPADPVPTSSWALADILRRAGCPKNVLNLVMGRGSEVGSALLNELRVAAIVFTGSVATGKQVVAACVARMAAGWAPIECNADGAPGRYLRPAPFTGATPSMRIDREEIREAPAPQPS